MTFSEQLNADADWLERDRSIQQIPAVAARLRQAASRLAAGEAVNAELVALRRVADAAGRVSKEHSTVCIMYMRDHKSACLCGVQALSDALANARATASKEK